MPRTRTAPTRTTASALLTLVVVACGGSGGGNAGGGNPPGNTTVSFQQDVLALFQSECVRCHGGAGGLILDNYEDVIAGGDSGPVVDPGNPDGSLLIHRLEGTITPQMPEDTPPLSPNEIGVIRQWILEGAQKN
jgi:hypothetical protein